MPSAHKSKALHTLNQLEPSLRTPTVVAMARSIQDRDTNGEIAELSSVFLNSLPSSALRDGLTSSARNFDKANTLTWISYSLLDTIVDKPELLPLSHTATTLSSLTALKSAAISLYAQHRSNIRITLGLFEQTDLAIHHELTVSRAAVSKNTITIPHIPPRRTLQAILSNKSLAHIIGPALLTHTLFPKNYRRTLEELRLYCGMRQLLDDLHDWEGDLRSGNITPVVAELLKKYGAPEESIHSFATLIPALRRLFWESIAEEFCRKTKKSAERSIESLELLLGMPADSPFIAITLRRVVRSTASTIDAIRSQKRILRTMRSKGATP